MATVVIQARLGSTRFPEKVVQLLPDGRRVIDAVIDAALSSKADNVVLATPDTGLSVKIPTYIWLKDRDVLGEFYNAAKWYQDDVIRLTGDCPLLTGEVIDTVLDFYMSHDADYVYNTHDDDPVNDGYDVEVFTYESLKEAFFKATSEYDREHVTPYIRRNFTTALCKMPTKEGCSINTYEDYIKVCQIMETKL